MSSESQQEDTKISPVIEAKSLLLNGDKERAFDVLKDGAENGDVMACYDCGFMMLQGIGCEVNLEEGLRLMRKGMNIEKESEDTSWKSNGTVTELLRSQAMNLYWLFFLVNCFK